MIDEKIELTDEQKVTITHLKENLGLKTNKEMIDWCVKKLKLPRRQKGRRATKNQRARKNSDVRKRSKSYYREIILFLRSEITKDANYET